jgi:hypothetical protein
MKAPVESSAVPSRPRRSYLWYFGIVVTGVLGLLLLFVAAATIAVLNEPSENHILVSDADQTYLEAVTENHGEGFLDGYDWLAIYYVHVGGWFRETQRILVYNNPHDTADKVSFQRSTDLHGQPQIVVRRGAKQDSAIAFVFTIPKDFDEFAAQRQFSIEEVRRRSEERRKLEAAEARKKE